jgi:hypothetical protein
VLGGTFALLRFPDAEARKKGKGKKKKKKKKKNRGGPSPLPPAPTCTDGARNGSETDVDCGGGCPRCRIGLGCVTRNDCANALCTSGTCRTCSVDTDCGGNAQEPCFCAQVPGFTERVCHSDEGVHRDNCTQCPSDEYCVQGEFTVLCYKPCAA